MEQYLSTTLVFAMNESWQFLHLRRCLPIRNIVGQLSLISCAKLQICRVSIGQLASKAKSKPATSHFSGVAGFGFRYPSCSFKLIISSSDWAVIEPSLLTFKPARCIACSIVSVVKIPKVTGIVP